MNAFSIPSRKGAAPPGARGVERRALIVGALSFGFCRRRLGRDVANVADVTPDALANPADDDRNRRGYGKPISGPRFRPISPALSNAEELGKPSPPRG